MSEENEKFQELLDKLKQQRDELALQIHLGKKEAQEEWEKLEKKYQELKENPEPIKKAVSESAEGVASALELAADELKKGYDRIRDWLEE